MTPNHCYLIKYSYMLLSFFNPRTVAAWFPRQLAMLGLGQIQYPYKPDHIWNSHSEANTINLPVSPFWERHWMTSKSFRSCLGHCLKYRKHVVTALNKLCLKGNLVSSAIYHPTWILWWPHFLWIHSACIY